jgi:hypothetical protein
MSIDFGKLLGGDPAGTVLPPREIFSVLPRKAQRYQYLRDVQAEVLGQWFERRNERDIIVKMNTGSGKTVVGLLILKSCLNEGRGPAVYVCPDNYLVQQVLHTAAELDIDVTDDPASGRFRRGQAILVINIYKLVNGRSVFGVGDEGSKIAIGSLVIDDAHACLSSTEGQFTMTLEGPDGAYAELFKLFRQDLYEQSEAGALDVEQYEPSKNMLVPYWAWINKGRDVMRILHPLRDTDGLKFVWPLLKENISLCHGVFGGGHLEISPRCLPIDVIPSFTNAERRVFMSATLADDSILVSDFDVDPKALDRPVTPSSASDIGDRMILVPQSLNPDVNDEDLKRFLKDLSTEYNVVVIVPSRYRAEFWADVADQTLAADNLHAGVEDLKRSHVGLVVMVNKYDGVDLPYDACRILAIDGLPDVRRRIDKIEEVALAGSDEILSQQVQRIEQGMGRGIRASDDQCVVLLMGRRLVSHLYTQGALDKFSPATRAQLELSERLSEQLGGKSLADLRQIMMYSLDQDTNWVRAGKGALVHVKYDASGKVRPLVLKQRQAFDAAQRRDYQGAVAALQEAIDQTANPKVRGWLKQQLAEYMHFLNPVDSQVVLRSAVNDNHLVLHPIEGISYTRLDTAHMNQGRQCAEHLTQCYPDGNKLVLAVHSLLDDLVFRPDTAPQFEAAMKALADLLGFRGQRPEAEYGRGPDVLWGVGALRYLVIECKNGATTQAISRSDCNQLSGSTNWFAQTYDGACERTPVMIHPVHIVEANAYPPAGMRVINQRKLDDLRASVLTFVQGVAASRRYGDPQEIAALLANQGLTGTLFVERFTVEFRAR